MESYADISSNCGGLSKLDRYGDYGSMAFYTALSKSVEPTHLLLMFSHIIGLAVVALLKLACLIALG